ncbi:MAG: phosphotransferase family protein [Pseudomonadota bacterium]
MPSPRDAGFSDAEAGIIDAVRRRRGAGVTVKNFSAATLGGSNRTLLFDVVEGATTERWVSRQETYTLPNSPFLPPEHQYQLLELAHAAHVPVPRPIFAFTDDDGLGRGYVVAAVAGETLPKAILSSAALAGARARFAHQSGEILALTHQIAVADAAFLEAKPDSVDPIAGQLERYEQYGEPHPAVDLAIAWLREHQREVAERVVLHGDYRNGNVIVDGSGIAAVLDWECAFIGDPMADLGWLCLRSWRFGNDAKAVGGIGERDALYEAYEQASGRAVDHQAVRWWEIFGFVRWIVLNIMQSNGHITGARRSPAFAACGRNVCLIEYDMLKTIAGEFE